MQAVREIRETNGSQLIINLPEYFNNEKQVEIIILPINQNRNYHKKKEIHLGIGKYDFGGKLDSVNLRDFANED